MYLIVLFVLILILVAFFEYLYVLNPIKIPLHYLPGSHNAVDYYLIFYIFAAFLIGILLFLIITLIKNVTVYLKNLVKNKKQFIITEIDNSIDKAEDLYIKAQYDKAIDILKRYMSKYENSIKAYLLLFKIYKHKGDFKSAETFINKTLEIDGNNVKSLNEAGNLYKLNKNYEKAASFFNKAVEIAPDNLYAVLQLKDLYIKNSEWKNAYKMSKLFLSQSKDKNINKKEERDLTGLKYEFGKFLLENENDLERSAKRFNQVISQDKYFVGAYISLGDILVKKDKTNDAFKLWEKAFLKTNSFAVIIKMEDVAIKINSPQNIIKFYQELIYNNPEKWEYRLFLAKFYVRIEMVDEAISNLKTIPVSIFKDSSLYLLLGECYLKRGKMNEASSSFRKALKNQYPVKLPFVCSKCNYSSLNYTSLCPSCFSWNTMNIRSNSLYESFAKEESQNIFNLS